MINWEQFFLTADRKKFDFLYHEFVFFDKTNARKCTSCRIKCLARFYIRVEQGLTVEQRQLIGDQYANS